MRKSARLQLTTMVNVMCMAYFLLFIFTISGCKSNPDRTNQSSLFPENKNAIIINDYSSILSDKEETILSKKLYNYEIATTNQIVFVSIDSITPYTDIQKYATDLGNHWGIGQKDKNNGLMLVLSKPMRQVGVATGFGAEKILTDSICKQVIETVLVPYFKEEKYYEGISNGLDSLMHKWDNQ